MMHKAFTSIAVLSIVLTIASPSLAQEEVSPKQEMIQSIELMAEQHSSRGRHDPSLAVLAFEDEAYAVGMKEIDIIDVYEDEYLREFRVNRWVFLVLIFVYVFACFLFEVFILS